MRLINKIRAKALANSGRTLAQRGFLQQGEQQLRRAISLDSKLKEAYNDLGITLTIEEKLFEAILIFREVLRIYPYYAGAHYNLADAYEKNDMFPNSIMEYQHVKRLQPNAFDARNNLAKLLKMSGRRAEAERELRDILGEVNYPLAQRNLAILLEDNQNLQMIKNELQSSISSDPNNAELHYKFGIALQDIGDYDNAEGAYRAALKLDPNLKKAHNSLGTLLADHGNVDEAIKEYQEALKTDPDFDEAHHNLALALDSLDRYKDSIPEWKRCSELVRDRSIRKGILTRIDQLNYMISENKHLH